MMNLKIPVMLKSTFCVLHGLDDKSLYALNECPYDQVHQKLYFTFDVMSNSFFYLMNSFHYLNSGWLLYYQWLRKGVDRTRKNGIKHCLCFCKITTFTLFIHS